MPANELVVREMIAVSPNAHRGLLGFLATLGDQYVRVVIPCAPGTTPLFVSDDSEPRGLPGYSLLHRVGDIGVGAAARILDVARVLAAHPSAARVRGELGIDLEDSLLPHQSGPFDVRFAEGKTTTRRGRLIRARLRLDVTTLAKIYFGAVRARALLSAGRVTGHAAAAELLDEATAGPPPFLGPLNGF
jgi:predicted acetyltransferase